jgi:UDPglucose 6-dehydrogenase
MYEAGAQAAGTSEASVALKVAMVGAGYVGLVTAVCLAEVGHHVVCAEIDAARLAMLKAGQVPIFEPGLAEMMQRNVASGRLNFTHALVEACEGADMVFLAVGTPPRPADGHADLRQIFAAALEIAQCASDGTIVVVKSTVPVGTGDEIDMLMRDAQPDKAFRVVSCPEFLREGAAIRDFMSPDRIVIGTDDTLAVERLVALFKPISDKSGKVIVTSRRSSELIKYTANAFLATKIAFINEIADLCEAVGANVTDVADGIGLDSRIGRKFLNAGPGFGGSCFPKDTSALLKTAHDQGIPLRIVETLMTVNDQRRRAMARKVIQAAGGTVRHKTIAVLGLTFKPDTDDMREAPSISIITALQDAGATIRAYDPEGMENASRVLNAVTFCKDAYDCLTGAHAAVLVTEWPEFSRLVPESMAAVMANAAFVDLRNVFNRKSMTAARFIYSDVGRS